MGFVWVSQVFVRAGRLFLDVKRLGSLAADAAVQFRPSLSCGPVLSAS